jgi:hypothetical protein
MNLQQAIDIVINEAEVSALGNKDDSQLQVLKALEVVKSFYNEYGVVFADFTKEQTMSKIILDSPPSFDLEPPKNDSN